MAVKLRENADDFLKLKYHEVPGCPRGFGLLNSIVNLRRHMLPLILHVLFGALVSFIGSLPMGLINLTVAETAISRGIRAALLLALGAVLVEFLQILVALFFADWFTSDPDRKFWIGIIGSIVFVCAGLYYLIKKSEAPHLKTDESTRSGNAFLRGLGLSAVNMLAIPFWLVLSSYSHSRGWLSNEPLLMVMFALGAVLGTFALFVAYARLGLFILRRSTIISQYAGKAIGLIFLVLGSWQLVRLLLE
ncbi:MAG: LysE family transporter [Bacteroidia bacterium]